MKNPCFFPVLCRQYPATNEWDSQSNLSSRRIRTSSRIQQQQQPRKQRPTVTAARSHSQRLYIFYPTLFHGQSTPNNEHIRDYKTSFLWSVRLGSILHTRYYIVLWGYGSFPYIYLHALSRRSRLSQRARVTESGLYCLRSRLTVSQ